MVMDTYHYNGVGGERGTVNCITLQKNVTFHMVDGNNGNTRSFSPYPTLPNSKSVFRLCGCFWSFKYFFEQSNAGCPPPVSQNHHHQVSGTKIESDACQIYLYLTKSHDSEVEFQLYCDAGPKASIGSWTISQTKWISVKIAFISPATKKIASEKKVEGQPRCGKLLCQCRQRKLCLRKASFCSVDYLQSFYVINKCSKPRHGMTASYFSSLDAVVSITLFSQNPNLMDNSSISDHYWKSQQEASKRIFHAMIGTDFKLEANGNEFPCHKCILAGHSEVFSKMFSSEKKQKELQQCKTSSTGSKLVMENMSAVGVDSFLKYLYYGDTSFAELPASVALELTEAAEKYNIPHLRRTSTEILVSKRPDDFDCKTALRMYLFTMNKNSHSQYSTLRRMALQCFSVNYVELVKSEDFVKLFVENRESAQEILIKIHANKKV